MYKVKRCLKETCVEENNEGGYFDETDKFGLDQCPICGSDDDTKIVRIPENDEDQKILEFDYEQRKARGEVKIPTPEQLETFRKSITKKIEQLKEKGEWPDGGRDKKDIH